MRTPALIAALASTAVLSGLPGEASAPASALTASALMISAPLCSGGGAPASSKESPALLEGFGTGGFPIRTSVPMAQRYFDNGLQLAHAFAHEAGTAAMREAVRLDPQCAACLWGEAWAAGPTINYPIGEAEAAAQARLVTRARALAANGPEKERALIEALALRYTPAKGNYAGDRVAEANLAYANAMDALTRRWPEDNEIAVITAHAQMIASFDKGGATAMNRALDLLEGVLRRQPGNTGAIHFYIHATEMTGQAGRAEAFADRLGELAPAASHLVHMPAHTFFRIGRYRDAAKANVRAVAISGDDARRQGLPASDGAWKMMYHEHNVRFGIGAALVSGDAKDAMELSDPLIARVAASRIETDGYWQLAAGTAYFAKGILAEPAAVLAMPAPPVKYRFVTGFWRYARGEAAARKGDAAAVRAEAKAISIPRADRNDWGSPSAVQTLRIARLVLEGRAAMLEGKPRRALDAFRRAAKLQEQPDYIRSFDPPTFWYPVHRDVAVAYLALGRRAEAMAAVDAALSLFARDPESERIKGRARMATDSR